MLNITSCVNSRLYSNFNLRCFMSPIKYRKSLQFTLFHVFIYYRTFLQILLFYKFFCTNISQVESEIHRNSSTIFRSSHRRCSIKKGFLKHCVIFTGKQLCRGLFLIELQAIRPVTLLNRDSNTDIFLWISENL